MVPRIVADASIFHTWIKVPKPLGGSVRSGVNKQVQLILASSGVGGLNEDVGIGLVDSQPHQIAVEFSKSNTSNGNGNLIGVDKSLHRLVLLFYHQCTSECCEILL